MGWREERGKVLRSKPITQQQGQAEDETRQNDIKSEENSFNPLHWIKEIEKLVEEINRNDTQGGCWEWAKKKLADKWRGLMMSMRGIDTAFEEQRADGVCMAIIQTRGLYHEIVNAWNSRPETVCKS
jgi:hypothetical protein